MSKAFTQIKVRKLSPQDKLTFGKYKDCRVCDVWEDYEYFLWLDKAKPGLFTANCTENFQAAKLMAIAKRHHEEEVAPYLQDDFDDVPF